MNDERIFEWDPALSASSSQDLINPKATGCTKTSAKVSKQVAAMVDLAVRALAGWHIQDLARQSAPRSPLPWNLSDMFPAALRRMGVVIVAIMTSLWLESLQRGWVRFV